MVELLVGTIFSENLVTSSQCYQSQQRFCLVGILLNEIRNQPRIRKVWRLCLAETVGRVVLLEAVQSVFWDIVEGTVDEYI